MARQVLGAEDCRFCLGCQKTSHAVITVVCKLLLLLPSEQLRKLAQSHPHRFAWFLTAIVEDIGIQAPGALTHLFNKYLLGASNVPGPVLGAGEIVLGEKDINSWTLTSGKGYQTLDK